MLYNATQAVAGLQKYFAAVFGLPENNVRVAAQKYLAGSAGAHGAAF